MKNGARILLLDLETAPIIGYAWRRYDTNLIKIKKDSYVLMWAAKWLNEASVKYDTVGNHAIPTQYDPKGEKQIAKSIHRLVKQANIIIAHNGDRFDVKWINALFIKHRLSPLTFKTIDTKKALDQAQFTSRSLAFIGDKLDLGAKLDTGGFELWEHVLAGNKRAWGRMVKYCKQDVVLLEKLYLRLKPYIKNHPNLALYQDDSSLACPSCSSTRFKKDGTTTTSLSKFQRYQCLDCMKYFRGRTRLGIVKCSNIS